MADRRIRRIEFATMIRGLVCHTSLKNLGRFRKAAIRSLNVSGSVCCPFCLPLPDALRSALLIAEVNKIGRDMLDRIDHFPPGPPRIPSSILPEYVFLPFCGPLSEHCSDETQIT